MQKLDFPSGGQEILGSKSNYTPVGSLLRTLISKKVGGHEVTKPSDELCTIAATHPKPRYAEWLKGARVTGKRQVLTRAHRCWCHWSLPSLTWNIPVPVTWLMIRKLWVSKAFSVQLNWQQHWYYASKSLSLLVFSGKRRIKAFFSN